MLVILTFLALMPALVKEFARDPLEVSFVYPSPDRPRLESGTYYALVISIFLSQAVLFIVSMITGIGFLKKQRWSWFFGIGLHALVVVVYGVALWLVPPYTTNDRLASMAISLVSLYLLSRQDVRNYLRPALSV